MELSAQSFIQAGYFAGTIIYLVAAVEYALILRKGGAILLPAFLFSAIWHQVNAHMFSLSLWPALGAELLRYGIWASVLLFLIHYGTTLVGTAAQRRVIATIAGAILATTVFFVVLTALGYLPQSQYLNLCLIFGLVNLLVVEQIVTHTDSPLIKIVAICNASLVVYDLYLFASLLIFSRASIEAIQIRGLAGSMAGLVIVAAPLFVARSGLRRLAVSRPLALSATSLLIAGALLLVMSVLGYTVRIFGEIEQVVGPLLTFAAVLIIALTLTSVRIREILRVWIGKNFYQQKYDYRTHWEQLNRRLSSLATDNDYLSIAMDAAFGVYNSRRGVIYLRQGDHYQPAYSVGVEGDIPCLSADENFTFFHQMTKREWIYFPTGNAPSLARYDHLIPTEIREMDRTLLILPLVNQDYLLGFIVLVGEPDQVVNLDWEDLDLMRMVAKQIANYVGYRIVADQLLQTRQFEAYQKLTAFVMHDLKNLIAQLALLVNNAAKYKDDPEFMADTIETISNSVNKMTDLLHKIQREDFVKSAHQKTPLQFARAVKQAVANCGMNCPEPELVIEEEGLMVEAMPSTLTTSLTHLIRNAQEATPDDGFVRTTVKREGNWAVCEIRDNGSGMDQEFIHHRLFKPFDSTKDSKGMGIGAYQCLYFINSIGGRIDVKSQPGLGTCLSVILPLCEPQAQEA